MILATIKMLIPPRKHDEALKILKAIGEQNRIRRGCLSCQIYKDVEEENVFVYEEMWRSEEDLKRHLQSNEYRNLLLVVEMALQNPEIKFNTITRQNGFEVIEKARGSIQAQGSHD